MGDVHLSGYSIGKYAANLCNAGVLFQMKSVEILQLDRLKLATRALAETLFPHSLMHSPSSPDADAEARAGAATHMSLT